MAKKDPMTKTDMITEIAEKAGITKIAAKAALESFVAMCAREVKGNRSFRVAGLGTFARKTTKARKGVNPATGEPIKIKSKKRMAFKPSTQIKDLLNPEK